MSEPPSRAHALADISPAGGAYRLAGEGCAADYTAALIASLGGRVARAPGGRDAFGRP